MNDTGQVSDKLEDLVSSCRNPADDAPITAGMAWAWLAVLAARHLPRGKGAVPRWISQRLIGQRRFALSGQSGFSYVGDGMAIEAICYYLRADTAGHDVVALCRALTGEREVFYDLGANVGHVTLAMADSHRDARIVSYRIVRAPAPAGNRNHCGLRIEWLR